MPNISLASLNYLQQIADANTNTNQHFEPGLWVAVPQTSDPNEPRTVARLASIPHGTDDLGPGHRPNLARRSLHPGRQHQALPGQPAPHPPTPSDRIDFPEQTLTTTTQFRTSGAGANSASLRQMVNNPNSVLSVAGPHQQITTTTTLHVASRDASAPRGRNREHRLPETGTKDGPNAVTAGASPPPSGCRRSRETPNPAGCSTHSSCC